MSSSDPWTVGRLLQWTTDYLKGRKADSPRLDAELLLAEALGCRRIELYTSFEDVPTEEKRTAFRALVRRRAEGEPVAYLLGRREFYSLSFRVGPGVLIPRPETELLIVTLLDLIKLRPGGASPYIADVGTGSGVVAVCAAKHVPGARLVATDTSAAALEVAAANAAAHGVADRIEFFQGDLLGPAPAGRQFDFILSNPPYVRTDEFEQLPVEVKNHEPREALLAGPRGTEVIERLAPQAADRLAPGGHLLIEVSPMIHEAARAVLAGQSALDVGPTIKDLARLPRIVQARKK